MEKLPSKNQMLRILKANKVIDQAQKIISARMRFLKSLKHEKEKKEETTQE